MASPPAFRRKSFVDVVVGVIGMTADVRRDPDLEWLDHVRPVGLVVAPMLLKDLGLVPVRQTPADRAVLSELKLVVRAADARFRDTTRSEIVGGIAGYRAVVQGHPVASLVEHPAIAVSRQVAGDVAVSQG